MEIEFIYDADCPNVDGARKHLEAACAQVGTAPRWREWLRSDPKAPEYVRAYGSPTVLVGGVDAGGVEASADAGCCRVYPSEDGRLAGVPPVDLLSKALAAAERTGDGSELRRSFVSVLSLFTSSGTLLCCALPAAIAGLAGGAAVGAFVSTFPWLIPLSRYHGWLFLLAGVMILINGVLTFRPRGQAACAIAGGGCETAGRLTRTVFWGSVGLYAVGAFFAYGIVPLQRVLAG